MSHNKLDEESSNSGSGDCFKRMYAKNETLVSKENSTDSGMYFGPALPPKSNSTEKNNSNKVKDSENSAINIGHALKLNSRVMGPVLPDHLKKVINEIQDNESTIYNSEPEENDVIGPLPAEHCVNNELEERAMQIKLNLLNKTDKEPITREEWMVELPDVKCVSQILGPRKFRNKEMPDMSDRSSWTDTPEQKAMKKSTDVKTNLETHTPSLQEKDLIQEKIVEKHKKNKRNKSLIDLHEEKRKKAKTTSDATERRPFSREIDLKGAQLSSSRTKEIVNKASLLDSRFASGQSKFL